MAYILELSDDPFDTVLSVRRGSGRPDEPPVLFDMGGSFGPWTVQIEDLIDQARDVTNGEFGTLNYNEVADRIHGPTGENLYETAFRTVERLRARDHYHTAMEHLDEAMRFTSRKDRLFAELALLAILCRHQLDDNATDVLYAPWAQTLDLHQYPHGW